MLDEKKRFSFNKRVEAAHDRADEQPDVLNDLEALICQMPADESAECAEMLLRSQDIVQFTPPGTQRRLVWIAGLRISLVTAMDWADEKYRELYKHVRSAYTNTACDASRPVRRLQGRPEDGVPVLIQRLDLGAVDRMWVGVNLTFGDHAINEDISTESLSNGGGAIRTRVQTRSPNR